MEAKSIIKYLVIAVAVIFGVMVLVDGIYSVDPGYRGVKVTLNKVEDVSLTNGIGFKWPFISDVVEININTTKWVNAFIIIVNVI